MLKLKHLPLIIYIHTHTLNFSNTCVISDIVDVRNTQAHKRIYTYLYKTVHFQWTVYIYIFYCVKKLQVFV